MKTHSLQSLPSQGTRNPLNLLLTHLIYTVSFPRKSTPSQLLGLIPTIGLHLSAPRETHSHPTKTVQRHFVPPSLQRFDSSSSFPPGHSLIKSSDCHRPVAPPWSSFRHPKSVTMCLSLFKSQSPVACGLYPSGIVSEKKYIEGAPC